MFYILLKSLVYPIIQVVVKEGKQCEINQISSACSCDEYGIFAMMVCPKITLHKLS